MNRKPRWPLKILEWLCDPELFDEIVGDLDEMYNHWLRIYGPRKAGRLYILHTIKFIRPFIFRKRNNYSHSAMTSNYFKVGWRNITRNTGFASINVVGLSAGLTCAILMYTLVSYHLSFDNFHGDLSRTYRFVTEEHGESPDYYYVVPQPLGKAFANDFDFAEKVARTRDYSTVIVSLPEEKDNKKFKEDNIVEFAEPAFFEIFNFPTVIGSAAAISEPNTALVTQEIAHKYFGSEDATNKVIRVNSLGKMVDFRIVGILKDFPHNSHFRRQIYLSYENLKDYSAWYASDKSWGSFNGGMQCFTKLKPNVTKEQVDAIMPQLIKKYYEKDVWDYYSFLLQPMSEVHYDTRFGASFSEKNVWTIGLAAFVILLIACINFVNLASAQVLNRSKEVGIRKVLGSQRLYIFMQFIVETGMIAVFSVVVACVFSQLLLPLLNGLLQTRLTIHFFDQWQLLVFLLATVMFVVVVSGGYPALLMTQFEPIKAMKQKLSISSGLSLRRVLITMQFVVSQALIICMIIIDSQMTYSVNTDLGYDKDAIVMISVPNENVVKMKTLRDRLLALPGVKDVSLCFSPPGSGSNVETTVRYGDHIKDEPWDINMKQADDKYVSTFNLKLVAGRNLLPSDSVTEFLVNETFVKKLGLASPNEVLGKMLKINGETMNARIEGVVKDFYTHSMHEEISPLCISSDYSWFRNLAAKVDMAQAQAILSQFNGIWNENYPNDIFSYQFVDDTIEQFYRNHTMIMKLVQIAAVVAILISCLGLYGMVSFMAVKKTKEIGIRKVLGASVPSIVWLFAREFAMLIGIAFAVAAPFAWMAMNKWLDTFVYHINITPLSFILAVLSTIFIAALTVSYHSMRSAMANPARSLMPD
jgi:putative ABC transport system permease protein